MEATPFRREEVAMETRMFRFLRLLLRVDVKLAAVILASLYLPFLLFIPDFTILVILFVLCLAALAWHASAPLYNRREDGTLYQMDAQERAEKVYLAKGQWWRY
jgi:hypothetical protein